MGKKSTPKPPDLTSLSDAQLQISKEQLDQAREQMNMSQDQFNKFVDQTNLEMQQSQTQYEAQMGLQSRALDQADAAAAVSKQVADKQIAAMDQNMGFAQADRDRYTNTFIPLQNQLLTEAQDYDSPERRAQAASQALADNQTQIEAQRNNTASQLASMGVDPSQVMSTSLSNQLGVAGAANGAMAANQARLQVEGTGRQLRAAAVDMGNGLPAQSQAGYQTASQAGNSAAANTNAATSGYSTASGIGATAAGIRQNSLNTASSITGSPMAWASLGNQSYGGASNGIMNSSSIQNQMYQNNMQAQAMKNQQSASTMSAIGSVAGIAGMAMMAEGGTVGQDGMPPIDWDSLASSTNYQPDTSMSVHDVPLTGIHALNPTAVSGSGDPRLGMGLMMAGQALQAPSKQPAAPAQNLLRPVYRAEGGAMGMDPGSLAPRGQQSQYQVMPNRQSRDKIPTMLSEGEIVIPADVARVKGQEFFDKLIQKHHRPGA